MLVLILTNVIELQAQMPSVPVPTPVIEAADEGYTLWHFSLLFLVLCLIGAVVWVINERKTSKAVPVKKGSVGKNNAKKAETNSLEMSAELKWLRKNQDLVKRREKLNVKTKVKTVAAQQNETPAVSVVETEKLLPVFGVEKLALARPFAPLPISNDEALMSAVEQTYDEFEEDEEVREIALRILTTFKTRNSVEALTQMALYDLSSTLRSKAVTTLSEFNHESVFEPVLQATADPTREVRAAAARAMSKLTIDRADAWTRIFESEEQGRMIQAARAATESGFVQMSFDRLVHSDEKYSYEAVALMALLIKAGETEEIFRVLETHKDANVKKALLHVIKITKDQRALEELCAMLDRKALPLQLQEEVDKTIEEMGFVTV